MAVILSGDQIAKTVLGALAKNIAGKKPLLAVIQVGKNPVSEKYVGEKEKIAIVLGAGFKKYDFAEDIPQEDLEKEIAAIGKDPAVSGMIVQLPLPRHIRAQKALDLIPEEKDADILSSSLFGKFALGECSMLPPTVEAIALLLEKAGVHLRGATVAVVGAGRLVGLPLIFWLIRQGATVFVAHKDTKDLASCTLSADVVISGTGKAGLITGGMIKAGAVVIDAGTSVEDGQTKGDVDFASVSEKAGFITPVPGGVGPLTVACLFKNLFSLHE
ncbi:MAG: bifunctional 5,10-methylenetetrahydrofolate dehydrogenase/5,10-methenyltetrahydrofolate cyclohydrolase [Candidatus Wildermuthbacteria bacterium]|nr:bifunctional 5,10-methylenetetrahydrofolate dehydrogenase/5,10-methenyltetrahydrofolate cyclohydrolase [Candidatus Wildermuthbacteria bacterium]